jgi:hypothetical protein
MLVVRFESRSKKHHGTVNNEQALVDDYQYDYDSNIIEATA